MGKLSNEADKVTINEVTVSHRATKNSPHDAVTWDPHGIRGVSMDGVHAYSNATQVVRSVNVSIGGVSFECDAGMLDVLSDKEARESLVKRSLEAQAEKDRQEATQHVWGSLEDDIPIADRRAWKCEVCGGFVMLSKGGELPGGGCLGRLPTDAEKRQADAAAAIQELGRILQALHEQARTALANGADPTAVLDACGVKAAYEGVTALVPAIAAADAELDQTETPAE